MTENKLKNKLKGTLYGGAAGDALGYPVEFLDESSIFKKYGERGITDIPLTETKLGCAAIISDDTQMTLFTLDGMISAMEKHGAPDISEYIDCIYESYLSWLKTQSRNFAPFSKRESELLKYEELYASRAPGCTCLGALGSGARGSIAAPINQSKGCGGIMRAAPIGFLPFLRAGISCSDVALLGAESAALTHGHRLGYIPSAFLAVLISVAMSTEDLRSAVRRALDITSDAFCTSEELVYFISLINRATELSESDDIKDDLDAIHILGEGWVAEETAAISVYCALKYSGDFEKALIASVNHSGDSDSTGAVTGNILGAYIGYDSIPEKFKSRLECSRIMNHLTDKLVSFLN